MNPQFNNQILLDAKDFILKKQWKFDFKFFLQIKGTSMGTFFAQAYANLTIAYHPIQVCFIIQNT